MALLGAFVRCEEGGLVLPWSVDLKGRFDEASFDSSALKGNALGDPSERPLWVSLPPGYDDDPDRPEVMNVAAVIAGVR